MTRRAHAAESYTHPHNSLAFRRTSVRPRRPLPFCCLQPRRRRPTSDRLSASSDASTMMPQRYSFCRRFVATNGNRDHRKSMRLFGWRYGDVTMIDSYRYLLSYIIRSLFRRLSICACIDLCVAASGRQSMATRQATGATGRFMHVCAKQTRVN